MRMLYGVCALVIAMALAGCARSANPTSDRLSSDATESDVAMTKEPKQAAKVILDTDMAYVNDDALAMYLLTQLDKSGDVDLLGVTTVGANVFVASATTAALRQLELIGRSDVPVYEGTDVPLQGFRNMEEESRVYGVPRFCGAYWDSSTNTFANMEERPRDYRSLPKEPLFGYAQKEAESQAAWDFMIEQVHKYPGEVTIMAIGAATNVAHAIQNDPDFVKDAAGIVYMGGGIDVPGNTTPAAELNWFYDPHAIRACLAAEWKSQIVVPYDLERTVRIRQSFYDRLRQKDATPVTELVLSSEKTFNADAANYVWDVVVPVVFVRPDIVTDLQTRYLTVETDSTLNSGRAVSWVQHEHNDPATGKGMPEGVRPVQIVMGIDENMFWDICIDVLSRKN